MPARYEPTTYDYSTKKVLPATTVTTVRLTDAELAQLDNVVTAMETAQELGRWGRYTRSAALKKLIADSHQ